MLCFYGQARRLLRQNRTRTDIIRPIQHVVSRWRLARGGAGRGVITPLKNLDFDTWEEYFEPSNKLIGRILRESIFHLNEQKSNGVISNGWGLGNLVDDGWSP